MDPVRHLAPLGRRPHVGEERETVVGWHRRVPRRSELQKLGFVVSERSVARIFDVQQLVQPCFDSLRGDARYLELKARIGLH